jgi:hypothetical protein
MKQVFVYLWHLRFWSKDFLKILLFSKYFTSCSENIGNFGTSRTNLKEDMPRHIPATKISFLSVIVSEKKMFKEKLTPDTYEMP